MSYILGVTEKYNEELLADRIMIEGLVIGCLYKEPMLFSEYQSITAKDFLTEDAQFYFGLGKLISERYSEFDQANIELFINDNEVIKEGYKARGGFTSIQEITNMVNVNSFADYLDNLAKSNLILRFFDEGIDATKEIFIEGKKIKPINLFKRMTAADVKNFYEARINAINVSNIKQDIIIEDLMIDDAFIEDCKSGENLGASYSTVLNWIDDNGEEQFLSGLPIMSYLTGGIHKGEVTLLGGYSGLGKALTLDSKLLGANGYMRMGDVKLGDKIYGEDGKLHNVIGVFPQGEKDIYRVTFSDGSTVDCCKEHIWTIQTMNDRKAGKSRDMTLEEIMKKGLYYNTKSGKKWDVFIPMTKPIEFETKEVPLLPYALGLLIGDGSFTHTNSITFTNQEADIVERLKSELGERYNVKNVSNKRDFQYSISDSEIVRTGHVGLQNGLKIILNDLGLLGCKSEDKFIPDVYKYNTPKVRLDILSGLIDTDGEVVNANYMFSTVSERLADDVCFLVESLGGTARKTPRQTYFTTSTGEKKAGKPSFRLTIKMPRDLQAFKSEKHKSKFNVGQNDARRCMRDITYIGKQQAQCIMVDNPSHLYLTNNCIVTHNSSITFTNFLMPLVNQGKKCCIISNEQKSKSFKQLLLAYVCATVFKNYKITRRKIQTWTFTPEENITVQKAMNFINTTFAGKLKFIKVFDYNIETVGGFIKKLALNDGFEYFLYDTFKAEDMTGSSVHGQMVEDSKYLFQIASKHNVAVIITQQLALHTEGQVSYLNASVLSSSKAVKEVVSELYLMRRVYNDIELDEKSKYFLNPHKLVKGADGKWKKEAMELDKEKQYRLLFLDKTRNGEDSKCIILKFEGQYGIWHELGYANPSRNPLPR